MNKELDSNNIPNNSNNINSITKNDESTHLSELKEEENKKLNDKTKDNHDTNNNSPNSKPFNNYGKIKILKYDKNNDPWLVLGPDYIYFIFLLFLNLLLVIFFAYVHYCYSSFIIRFFGMFLSLLELSIYIYCALKNPGYPKKAFQDPSLLKEPGGFYRKCRECGIIVDLRKMPAHCYDCKVCCEGFDHHCSFSTKCIGSGNNFEFKLFLTTFFILICYFGISALWFDPDYNKCRIKFF